MRKEKLKVLIVDDSPLVVKRLFHILFEIDDVKCIGHASQYEDALRLVEKSKPDVVLLDIQLPKKNGIDILVSIKSKFKKVKVVMLSNFSDKYYKNLCFTSGCDYFLDKSTEFEKIEGTLLNIIKHENAFC